MTRLRMIATFTTGNDHPDGAEIRTFHPGDEVPAAQKTGSYWWTSTNAREAHLIPDWAVVEIVDEVPL